MDVRGNPREALFRTQVRAWLARCLPSGVAEGQPPAGRWDLDTVRYWTREIHHAGYAGLTWPVEYGGRGLPPAFEAIYLEETARAGAPAHIGIVGLGMVGPAILAHGTAEQKASYLPRILSGGTVFCLGLSEPEAGCDLAAERIRAVRDSDDFVLSGQKVWSSDAHLADECLLLARTGSAQDRHRGLTCFLVCMSSPGLTVRPLCQLTGESELSEIELCDVRVRAGRVLGKVGGGWAVAMTVRPYRRSPAVSP
jgi:alkylation response protein AidB-like acyl-CoA dehydrogenase